MLEVLTELVSLVIQLYRSCSVFILEIDVIEMGLFQILIQLLIAIHEFCVLSVNNHIKPFSFSLLLFGKFGSKFFFLVQLLQKILVFCFGQSQLV